jgi:hypothetical protein
MICIPKPKKISLNKAFEVNCKVVVGVVGLWDLLSAERLIGLPRGLVRRAFIVRLIDFKGKRLLNWGCISFVEIVGDYLPALILTNLLPCATIACWG